MFDAYRKSTPVQDTVQTWKPATVRNVFDKISVLTNSDHDIGGETFVQVKMTNGRVLKMLKSAVEYSK